MSSLDALLTGLLVLAVVAIILLGGGRFSNLMGDVAKGVKSFKKGLADDDEAPKPIEGKSSPMAAEVTEEKTKAT